MLKRTSSVWTVLRRSLVLTVGLLGLSATGVPAASEQPFACTDGERPLRLGFYAHFEPVSYSASGAPGSAGFDTHRGYEADLLNALEAIEDAGLTFTRRGIDAWEQIWQLPTGSEFDIVGGGITILDSRTRDADGDTTIVFTAGHIAFRQSLLVRAEDAGRLARHGNLGGPDKVGVFAGTTGEARLLELTGITDASGVLVPGTQVFMPQRTVIADGGTDYVINAAGASPSLARRQQVRPTSAALPTVIHFSEETALIGALATGEIDAVARGEVGNRAAARAYGDALAVTALDTRSETGGFALAAADAALAACLDRHINWLTDGGRIGFRDWLDDTSVFMRRARQRSEGKRSP